MSPVWLMSKTDVAKRLSKHGCKKVEAPEGATTFEAWQTKEGRYFTVPYEEGIEQIPDWKFQQLIVQIFGSRL